MKTSLLKALISSLLVFCILSSATSLATVSVGVKEGDWIEYQANFTDTPHESSVDWMRVDVKTVEESKIIVALTGHTIGGLNFTERKAFDLEVGAPGLLIVPANLDVGDVFYHEDFGNITIEGVDELTCANSTRTTVYASTSNGELHWDKTTGFLLQQELVTSNYAHLSVATKTNMWQPQQFGLELLFAFVLLIAAIVAVFLFRRNKKASC